MPLLNSLPDDCLLPIFDIVPLMDLLLLDQVCHRFAALLPSALCRRRSLTLLLPDDPSSPFHYQDFRIPFTTTTVSLDGMTPIYVPPAREQVSALELPNLCLTERSEPLDWTDQCLDSLDMSVGYLAGLFSVTPLDDVEPTVLFTEMARLKQARISGQLYEWFKSHFTELHSFAVVYPYCSEEELILLIRLLEFWGTTLVGSLKLWLRIYIDNIDRFEPKEKLVFHPVMILFKVIGQLSSLKHQLTLDISGIYSFDEHILGFALPEDLFAKVSSQLRVVELYFGQYDIEKRLNDFVNRLTSSSNSHLRQIGFGDSYDLAALHEQLSINAPQASFRHICFPHSFDLNWMVNCARFATLNVLRFNWRAGISFTQLATNLAMLPVLSHLELDVSFPSHPPEPFAQSNNHQIISLPQIKVLYFRRMQMYSHLDFQSLSPLVFPSVMVAFVVIDNTFMCASPCQVCARYVGLARNHDLTLDQEKKCRQLMMPSLKSKLPALRRLYYKLSMGGVNYVDWLNGGQDVAIDQDDDLSQIVNDLKAQNPVSYNPFEYFLKLDFENYEPI